MAVRGAGSMGEERGNDGQVGERKGKKRKEKKKKEKENELLHWASVWAIKMKVVSGP